MISFWIMTVLLVTMACVVHYDLLGLFPANGTFGRRSPPPPPPQPQPPMSHRHGQTPPAVLFDRDWLPRPGTDAGPFRPQPTIIVDDYDYDDDLENAYDGDDDDDWSDPRPDERIRNVETGDAGRRPTATPRTTITVTDDDGGDYVAPGEERDDDVF